MPRASIIIPCYNAEKYLSDTLRSAQSQTERDIEIICADNNSTEMAEDLRHNRRNSCRRSAASYG
jgi:glycosyltransferase involved in cell wall biosynthesis